MVKSTKETNATPIIFSGRLLDATRGKLICALEAN